MNASMPIYVQMTSDAAVILWGIRHYHNWLCHSTVVYINNLYTQEYNYSGYQIHTTSSCSVMVTACYMYINNSIVHVPCFVAIAMARCDGCTKTPGWP